MQYGCGTVKNYLDLLTLVIDEGISKPTGAKLESTGKHVSALTLFAPQLRFDLQRGFPAVTTKRLFFRGVVAELLWFLSGSTNVKDLQAKDVHIWDQWASETGEIGPTYGHLWRDFGGGYGEGDGLSMALGVDQIARVEREILAVKANPVHRAGRRILLSAWDPATVDQCKLPPCHVLTQFVLTEGRLHCQMVMRSADLYLGVPWNIACYALLTHLLAHVTGVGVGTLVVTMGDCHIYENHLDQVKTQIRREPLPLPTLWLNPDKKRLADFTEDDIAIKDYHHHSALPGEVAV